MADTPISLDPTLAAASIATGDLIPIVDISEPAAADKNKNTTFANLTTYLQSNLSHDSFSDYVSAEHINWTNTTQNLQTTGSVRAAQFVTSGGGPIHNLVNTGSLSISGSTWSNVGANILLFGEGHATTPYDIYFRSASTTELLFDYSANEWNFQANAIRTTDLIYASGLVGSLYNSGSATGSIYIMGGSDTISGSGVQFFGESHALNAYDILFVTDTTTELHFDNSANLWSFQSNNIKTSGIIYTDTINENSGAAGVTIDGVLVKDGQIATTYIQNLSGTNTGDEVSATDAIEGIIELATQAEVDAGTATNLAVTPDTLANYSGFPAGGAFSADVNTSITPSTSIVLDQATGDERALDISYTVNKATSGNTYGYYVNLTETASPGTDYLFYGALNGTVRFYVNTGGVIYTGGTVSAGQISAGSVETNSHRGTISTGTAEYAGGTGTGLGGRMLAYGNSHATQADDIEFYASATLEAHFDSSASVWDFQANDITTTGRITGAFRWANKTSSHTGVLGDASVFTGASAYVLTLPATFGPGSQPILAINGDVNNGTVDVDPTTGDTLYFGNEAFYSSGSGITLRENGDSVLVIPTTSNSRWQLIPLHVNGGLKNCIDLGTPATSGTAFIDIGEADTFFVTIANNSVTIDINTLKDNGDGYYMKEGFCYVNCTAAVTGLTVTTDVFGTRETIVGTAPSASGEQAILKWRYFRKGTTTVEYIFVEWINDA